MGLSLFLSCRRCASPTCPLPCRHVADLFRDSHDGFTDIDREYRCGEAQSRLRDTILNDRGKHSLDLALVIAFDTQDENEDAKMTFMLIPRCLVRIGASE